MFQEVLILAFDLGTQLALIDTIGTSSSRLIYNLTLPFLRKTVNARIFMHYQESKKQKETPGLKLF